LAILGVFQWEFNRSSIGVQLAAPAIFLLGAERQLAAPAIPFGSNDCGLSLILQAAQCPVGAMEFNASGAFPFGTIWQRAIFYCSSINCASNLGISAI